MKNLNPLLFLDFYKAVHKFEYPEGTNLVYSNFTPRKSRNPNINRMGFFGLQYIIKEYLIDNFQNNFFKLDKNKVVKEYEQLMQETIGGIPVDHIEELHDLGYLPLKIKAIPEGTFVPMGTPCMTFWNTHPKFFWLTNYLETMISSLIWKPCTSLTTANIFYENFYKYAQETGGDLDFVKWQGHDFSFRGMSGTEDACSSGAAHLIRFTGTDTVPAIPWIKEYYPTNSFIGGSIPASEHSVLMAGGDTNEVDTIVRLLTKVHPKGPVSIVSDTWDFWNVIGNVLPSIKNIIMNRDGKSVWRPDTGIPHKIVNGDPNAETEIEKKGMIRSLYETFGGAINKKGFIDLCPQVGYIYGDGINVEEQERILSGLKNNGFSTTCGCLGLGSYTYQYTTRDVYGTVCKSTYCEINNVGKNLFKSPKTGSWKKSHKGLLRVNSDLTTEQEVSWEREGGILEPVFENGRLLKEWTFEQVRENCRQSMWYWIF